MINLQVSGSQTLECHELVTFEGGDWATEILGCLPHSQLVVVLNSDRAVHPWEVNKLRII